MHCVTFAAPPVCQSPITTDPNEMAAHHRGEFLAVINEGDPAPLAQKEYILKLLEVCAKSLQKLEEEGVENSQLPSPTLRLSGGLLLMRDEKPDEWNKCQTGMYKVTAETVQAKLFGNPLLHFMTEYRARLYHLLGLVADDDSIIEL